MTGTKALFLDDYCRSRGRAFVRFDYFGHGASSGDFALGTIGRWREDAIAVVDSLTTGPQILVGSSMSGWIMLLAALARPERVAALVGIAGAPDFTEDLLWPRLSPAHREALMAEGRVVLPSDYDAAGYLYTRALIEDGRRHLLLGGPVTLDIPVRLLHGMRDEFGAVASEPAAGRAPHQPRRRGDPGQGRRPSAVDTRRLGGAGADPRRPGGFHSLNAPPNKGAASAADRSATTAGEGGGDADRRSERGEDP